METFLFILLCSSLVGFIILEVFFRKHPSKKSMKPKFYPSIRLSEDISNLVVTTGKMVLEVLRLGVILIQAVLWVVLWPVSLWYGNKILTKYKYPN